MVIRKSSLEKIKKPKILVIGGTGFIGHHIVRKAIKKNWIVESVSLRKPSQQKKIPNVKYITLDLKNCSETESYEWPEYDYIINLGGYIKHDLFKNGGIDLIEQHFYSLLNLIKSLPRKKIKRFIQIGSSDEYGDNLSPQTESQRENPISPYSLGKVSSTHFLQMLYKTEKFPAVILRLFLTYGPGQSTDRFIPQVILGCLNSKSFPVSEGKQLRNFCYIDDTVDAIFAALVKKGISGEIFNVGSKEPVQIKNIIFQIRKIIGKGDPLLGNIKYREGENMSLYPNIYKIKNILNWEPKIKLDVGLKKTINWYKKNYKNL